MEKTYPFFLKNPRRKEVIKVVEEQNGFVQFYYVQTFGYDNGGFICRRGLDNTRKDLADCYLEGFDPATEQDYIEALKEYFGADKKLRDHFIKLYNLK